MRNKQADPLFSLSPGPSSYQTNLKKNTSRHFVDCLWSPSKAINLSRLPQPSHLFLITISLLAHTHILQTHDLPPLLQTSERQLERFLFDLSPNTPALDDTPQLPHSTVLEVLPLAGEESCRPRQITAGSDRFRPP